MLQLNVDLINNPVLLIISIMLSISGIIFGIGYSFNNKKLREIGEKEFLESIFSGMLFGSIVVICTLINQTMPTIFGNVIQVAKFSCPVDMHSNSAACFAYSFLVGKNGYSIGQTNYQSLLSQSTMLYAILLGIYVALSPLSLFLQPILREISTFLGYLNGVMILALVQSSLINFFNAVSLKALFPAGIALRSFKLSRKLGSFVIAIAISTYVIAPISYAFGAAILHESSQIIKNSVQINESIGHTLDVADAINFNGIGTGWIGIAQTTASSIESYLSSLYPYLAMLILNIAVIPAFCIAATFISMREIAAALDSDYILLPYAKML